MPQRTLSRAARIRRNGNRRLVGTSPGLAGDGDRSANRSPPFAEHDNGTAGEQIRNRPRLYVVDIEPRERDVDPGENRCVDVPSKLACSLLGLARLRDDEWLAAS